MVKEAEVGLKPLTKIGNAVVGVQVDVLVRDRAPEPFNKDVDLFPYIDHNCGVETVALEAF